MKIIDRYQGYQEVYDKHHTIDELINGWYLYMEQAPLIRQMCIRDYEENNYNWKDVAKEKVFVHSHDLYQEMNMAYLNLLEILESTEAFLQSTFPASIEIELTIYHGLGNAAGWAEIVQDKAMILLGIEKIAELGWTSKERLQDLIVHEYAHIVHEIVRGSSLLPFKDDVYKRSIFHLYIEGFATYCEDILHGRDHTKPQWYQACKQQEDILKNMYNRHLEQGKDTMGYFGDWHKVLGLIETGYFMGYQIVKRLAKEYSLEEIMTLPYSIIEKAVLSYLHEPTRMKYLLVRADDLGYSLGINQGIEETVKHGFVKNVGLMVNLDTSQDGFERIKNEDIAVGLHCNVTVGKPLSNPSMIPSLVDETGVFIPSSYYRKRAKDFDIYDEVLIELEAQYQAFINITNRQPDYIESHAVYTDSLSQAMKLLAKKYDIPFSPFPIHGKHIMIKDTSFLVSMNPETKDYNPEEALKRLIHSPSEYGLFVVHPGYVDAYVKMNSSLQTPRELEIPMLCNENIQEYVIQQFQCITYRDL